MNDEPTGPPGEGGEAGRADPRSGYGHLLDAIVAIGGDLELSAVLHRVVEAATALAGARYGALGVLDPDRSHLAEFVAVGLSDEQRSRMGDTPKGHGILGLLIGDPRPIRLPDLHRHPDSFGFPPGHPPMTTFLGVPIVGGGESFGNLYLTDKLDGGPFTDADEELVVALAAAAAAAIDNARLHRRAREIDLIEDRERIARELHDTVIQRLFATGLSLQAAARFIDRPEAIERIQRAIDDLDDTVRDIRTAIFGLHRSDPPGGAVGTGTVPDGLRRRLIAVGHEQADGLGFEPTMRFDGPVDTMVSSTVADHVVAVVREALANVARHAGATAAAVSVLVGAGRLVVTVADDGVGPAGSAPSTTGGGNGLVNVSERARVLGGQAALEPRDEGGAILRWSVPLD